MNILFLTKYSILKGGVGKVLLALAQRFEKEDHNVIIYSSHKEDIYDNINGIKYICGDLPVPKFRIIDKSQSVKKIISVCKKYNIDIMHCHGAYRAGFAGCLVKKYTSIPYVVTSHGDLHIASSRTKKKSFQTRIRKILKNADFVTHLSKEMKEYTDAFFKNENNKIIRNGIDLQCWGKPANNLTGNYILYVGRLEEEKGVHNLLESYSLINKKDQLPLIIVGDGSEKKNIQALASKKTGIEIRYKIDSFNDLTNSTIYFTGWISGNKIIDFYKNAKLCVVPSQFESFGIILLESMVAGKALVVSDLKVFREILSEGYNGEFVMADSPNEWKEKIEKLLKDDELRKKYEMNNAADIQSFDWDKIATEYLKVLYGIRKIK